MDFMNLNQSAHGDREFGFIETRMGLRRKTVVGHWREPAGRGADRRWTRAAAAGTRRRRSASRASATTCARSRSPRATRSRRRSGSASPSTATASASSARRSRRSRTQDVGSTSSASTKTPTTSPRSFAPEATAASRCATPRGSRPGCARSSSAGGFRAFTDTFEDLDGLAQLPGIAVQRLMADGYGFGARGRLEDGRARADREGDEQRPRRRDVLHGGLHVRPRSGGPTVLGAHMLEVCPSIAAGRPSCEIHPLSIGGKRRSGAARLHGGTRARPCSSGCSTSAIASGSSLNEVELVQPPEDLPRLPGRTGAVGPEAGLRHRRRGVAARRRPAPHRPLPRDRRRGLRRPRGDRRDRAARDRRARRGSATSRTSCAGTRRTTASRGGL